MNDLKWTNENGMALRIAAEPKGFRDVYWCWAINEPGFIDYENDVAVCGLCKYEIQAAGFERTHTFIGHIFKPNKAMTASG